MDYHNGIGSHINIPMQSIDNSLWVRDHRAPRMPTLAESYGTDGVVVRSRIHSIEKEAYTAVLRAFIAQSDVLSWGKEGLITELRRELNVTDQEHRKLLTEIESDESVRMIREWRKSTYHAQELPSSRMDAPGFVSSSVSNAPLKISMTSHPDVSMLQRYVSHSQPISAANPSPFPAQYRNGQRIGELPTYSTSNAGQQMKVVIPNVMAPSASKRRGPVKPPSKKGFHFDDVDNLQKTSDVIKIRATNKLLHKVRQDKLTTKKLTFASATCRCKKYLKQHDDGKWGVGIAGAAKTFCDGKGSVAIFFVTANASFSHNKMASQMILKKLCFFWHRLLDVANNTFFVGNIAITKKKKKLN